MNPHTAAHPAAGTQPSGSRRRLSPLRSAVLAGSVLALAGGATAIAVPLALAGTTSSSTTIRLISTAKSQTRFTGGGVEVDVDKNAAGKVVGADSLICRVASRTAPPKCAATISLAKGDLFFTVTGTRTGATGRLVRGTGAYARDSGKITATNITATKTQVVIKLHS
jgi:hypothetical protein